MLDFRQVGDNLDTFRQQLSRRSGFDASVLDRVKALYSERADVIHETQRLQAERNAASAQMEKVMRGGTEEEKTRAREQGKALSAQVKDLEGKLRDVESK